jgi:hypothetical protein
MAMPSIAPMKRDPVVMSPIVRFMSRGCGAGLEEGRRDGHADDDAGFGAGESGNEAADDLPEDEAHDYNAVNGAAAGVGKVKMVVPNKEAVEALRLLRPDS